MVTLDVLFSGAEPKGLDLGIVRIKDYLRHQLDMEPVGTSQFHIDLAVLGLSMPATDNALDWLQGPVYPIRLYHKTVIVGPAYNGAGPCPRCLERRFMAIRAQEEQQVFDALLQPLIFGESPWLTDYGLEAIWQLVKTHLLQQPTERINEGEASIWALDLGTLHVKRHVLIADSFCPVCARPKQDSAAILSLTSRPKRSQTDYRLIKPTEYDLPLQGYINPICGLLGPTSVPEHMHTVTAPVSGKFYHKNKYATERVWWGGHSTSFAVSRRIGVLEGLERYTGHWARMKRVSVFDSYQNLQADALDPRTCGLYRAQDYARLAPVYDPFRPDQRYSWVWGYSFGQQRPLLVPEQLAYYCDFQDDHQLFVTECSNGCAIGSCLEEAILFGLLELVERDGFLLSWYAHLSVPRIDPRSCHDLNTLLLLDRIERLGYDLHFLDTRFDIRLPTVTAIAVKRNDELGKVVLAAGASLDPEDAIRGALCEVAAYVPSLATRVQDRLVELREMARDHSRIVELEHHPLVYGLPEMSRHAEFLWQSPLVRTVEETYARWLDERPKTDDLLDDVNFCMQEMFRLGLDVIVVDQTCPEQQRTGLKVARVIVPGLMPIDFGWSRQRVYELPRLRTVPRSAGYSATDFDPAYLNTTPHPFP